MKNLLKNKLLSKIKKTKTEDLLYFNPYEFNNRFILFIDFFAKDTNLITFLNAIGNTENKDWDSFKEEYLEIVNVQNLNNDNFLKGHSVLDYTSKNNRSSENLNTFKTNLRDTVFKDGQFLIREVIKKALQENTTKDDDIQNFAFFLLAEHILYKEKLDAKKLVNRIAKLNQDDNGPLPIDKADDKQNKNSDSFVHKLDWKIVTDTPTPKDVGFPIHLRLSIAQKRARPQASLGNMAHDAL